MSDSTGSGLRCHPNRAVYAAIGANLAVATAKFVAAALTGSSSMLAEGIHSTVDAGNDGLLLLGSRARRHGPDQTHPFGYGKAEYYWTLIVAMLIFALGGRVSALGDLGKRLAEFEPDGGPGNLFGKSPETLDIAALLIGAGLVTSDFPG